MEPRGTIKKFNVNSLLGSYEQTTWTSYTKKKETEKKIGKKQKQKNFV